MIVCHLQYYQTFTLTEDFEWFQTMLCGSWQDGAIVVHLTPARPSGSAQIYCKTSHLDSKAQAITAAES